MLRIAWPFIFSHTFNGSLISSGGKYEIHGQAAWHLDAAMIMAVISQRDMKIPTVAGTCIPDGFIADSGSRN